MKKGLISALMVLIIGTGYAAANISGLIDIKPAAAVKTVETPEQLSSVKREGLAPNSYANVFVVRIVDGDTFEATYKGETQKVRMLCVDTPESVKRNVPLQPYGKEASRYTSSLILDKSVRLVFEKGLRDRYGRLLAHVLLKDGSYLNGMLVRNGFARVEIVSPNKKFAEYFYKLQDEAIMEKTGFWSLPPEKRPFIEDEKGDYIPSYLKEAS